MFTALMKVFSLLNKDLIVLLISHRPVSIKMPGKIILMAAGELEDIGAYRDLVERNDDFTEMIAHSETDTSGI